MSITCPGKSDTETGTALNPWGTYSAANKGASDVWVENHLHAVAGEDKSPTNTDYGGGMSGGMWGATLKLDPTILDPEPTENTLFAKPQSGNPVSIVILYKPAAPDPCAKYTFVPPEDGESPPDLRLEGVTFTNILPRPVDGNDREMPLTLASTGPVTFTVGGSLPSSGRAPKVVLKSKTSLSPQVESDAGEWSCAFANVRPGDYMLCVTADDGSEARMEMIIKLHGAGRT
jgi:hypothetical protein